MTTRWSRELEGVFAVLAIGIGDDGVLAVDEHGVNSVLFLSAKIEGGDLGHVVAEVHLRLLIEVRKLLLKLLVFDGLESGVVSGDRSAVSGSLNVILAPHGVDASAFATEVAGHEGEVAEGLHVVDAANVLCDTKSVVDGSEVGLAIPEAGLLDVGGGHFADFGGPLGSELFEVLDEVFELGGSFFDKFFVHQSFAANDVSHAQEQGDIGTDPNGKVEMS